METASHGYNLLICRGLAMFFLGFCSMYVVHAARKFTQDPLEWVGISFCNVNFFSFYSNATLINCI